MHYILVAEGVRRGGQAVEGTGSGLFFTSSCCAIVRALLLALWHGTIKKKKT